MNSKNKGIVFIIFSAFFFALMNVFVRMAGDIPSIQKSFFRNLVAFLFALAIIMKNKDGFSIQKKNLPYFLLRSIFGTMGIFCNFYAVDHLVLADASMLNKMSPFFAVIFSIFILKEKVKPAQAFAIITAFLGSLFIMKPTIAGMDISSALIGLLGGACAGIAYTFVRFLGQRGEKGSFIVLFFSAFSCAVVIPYLIVAYTPMSLTQLGFLLLAGAAAAGGQFSITAAYCHAPAREISVYDYSQVIFSTLLGFFFFGQIPDGYSFLGYAIICSMAVFMYLYNRRACDLP